MINVLHAMAVPQALHGFPSSSRGLKQESREHLCVQHLGTIKKNKLKKSDFYCTESTKEKARN